jgi:hypothetical protein
MPIKIEGDYREILIDILFAIIIVVGFERFVHEFLVNNIENGDIMSPPIMIGILFFFSTYFWVISHWITYHELITKYPYYRWRKFFVDVFLFSVMFIGVNISFWAYKYEFTLLLVSLLIVWHFFACLWHFSDSKLRPLRLYLKLHAYRVITYAGIFSLLLFLYSPITFIIIYADLSLLFLYGPLETNLVILSYPYGVMVTIILALVLWNVHRLWRFTSKDSRYYDCDYIRGYPGKNTQDKGQLEMVTYPIKKKKGERNDEIKFKSNNSSAIKILAKDIKGVKIEPDPPDGTDLLLKLYCKSPLRDGIHDVNITVVFNLDDLIIDSVGEGIKELIKKTNMVGFLLFKEVARKP